MLHVMASFTKFYFLIISNDSAIQRALETQQPVDLFVRDQNKHSHMHIYEGWVDQRRILRDPSIAWFLSRKPLLNRFNCSLLTESTQTVDLVRSSKGPVLFEAEVPSADESL